MTLVVLGYEKEERASFIEGHLRHSLALLPAFFICKLDQGITTATDMAFALMRLHLPATHDARRCFSCRRRSRNAVVEYAEFLQRSLLEVAPVALLAGFIETHLAELHKRQLERELGA
jgi:hypothetical protein